MPFISGSSRQEVRYFFPEGEEKGGGFWLLFDLGSSISVLALVPLRGGHTHVHSSSSTELIDHWVDNNAHLFYFYYWSDAGTTDGVVYVVSPQGKEVATILVEGPEITGVVVR